MGRAIDQDNRLDVLEKDMKELQAVVAELSQALMNTTQIHHVDLTEDLNGERNVVTEGVEVKPDEEFTPPTGKRKNTKKVEKEETRVVESLL